MFQATPNRLLKDLSNIELKEVQTLLKKLGFYPGDVDGIHGPLTQKGWETWKSNTALGGKAYLPYIGQFSWELLQREASQKAEKQHNFSTKAGVIEAIIYECKARGLLLKSQWAYVIATVDHETAGSFKPVEEGYYLRNPKAHQKSLRYYPYYGRGYVQLTWERNYEKYGKILGVDLVRNPHLACDPNVALFVLVHGFKYGGFTGRKLEHYVTAQNTDFAGARECINGTDDAQQIAALARNYLRRL